MAIRQLATECNGKDGCPGVWAEDGDPDDVIVVGQVVDPCPLPLGAGEVAVRLRRRTIADAVAGV